MFCVNELIEARVKEERTETSRERRSNRVIKLLEQTTRADGWMRERRRRRRTLTGQRRGVEECDS